MKKAKLWNVKFGNDFELVINAKNARRAIEKALKTHVDWTKPRLKDITEIELLATED